MILTARSEGDSAPAESTLEFVSRLWFRTAVAAWSLWLLCVALALLRDAGP